MSKEKRRETAFGFGLVLLFATIFLAISIANPTPFQYTVFRILLSLAAAGAAATIPGLIKINIHGWLRASGPLAVFVVVYFYNPAPPPPPLPPSAPANPSTSNISDPDDDPEKLQAQVASLRREGERYQAQQKDEEVGSAQREWRKR